MRLSLLLFALLISSSTSAQGTGTIAGQVLEDDGVTTVIGANVRVDGTTLGAVTDIDGNYRIIGVPTGTYSVMASYVGYVSQMQTNVDVNMETTRLLNFVLSVSFVDCGPIIYEPPLFTNEAIGMSRILLGSDIEQMPLNR